MERFRQPIKTKGSYAHKEMAITYFPKRTPDSASRQLTRWIRRDPDLTADLKSCGYRPGQHIYTPLQVEVIVSHLGEPGDE